MKNLTFRLTVCFALLLATIVGCGGATDHPPTVPVSGFVTLDGQPVSGATIAFVGDGQTGLAISGPDGRFQLTTFAEGDGAVEGEYKVTVVKMVGSDVASGGDDSMEAAEAESKTKQVAATAQSALPSRYSDPETSGLQFSVKKGEANDFTLPLSQ